MKYILLSIFIFSNFLFSSEVQVTGLKNKNPERVLYIGNSYLYYNDSLHNHVRRMLEEFYANEIDTTEKPSPKLKDKIIRSLTYKGWEIDKVIKLVNQLTK